MFHFLNALAWVAVITAPLSAQVPRWRAEVPAPERRGMHAIVLSPQLLGASRADLGDIRLLDSTGAEVPYVLRAAAHSFATSTFVPYTLLRNEVLDKRTEVEIESPVDRHVDELQIRVGPADVTKRVRVTGSDDREHWFMVKDDQVLSQGSRGEPPYQVLSLSVPRTGYRYLLITLNDSLTPPMRVADVGRYADEVVPARYRDAGPLQFIQQDSSGRTFLRVRGPFALQLDRLTFRVGDAGGFHRNGEVVAWNTVAHREKRRQRMRLEREVVGTFTMASDRAPVIALQEGTRLDTFDLVVDNGDDRPLTFTSLEGGVLEHLLVADLYPGMRYTITTGDALRPAPHYDLVHFETAAPAPADTLITGGLIAVPGRAAVAPGLDPGRWWMWAVIIALMAGMGWMAVRMLRDQRADR
ncbi:MAG TPA: DUF3999 family protein [Flavobacteriales bacterium]